MDNPILNQPYQKPSRHWRLTDDGALTQIVEEGRRRSEYFVPIAAAKKRARQAELELDRTDSKGRAFRPNELVNEIRTHVESWRELPPAQWGVTHETAKLLEHWRSGTGSPPPFFCQIEAAETIIWLEEVAAKQGQYKSVVERLRQLGDNHSSGVYRLAAKMATGSGKTTVMAMLIAWQAVNAARGRKNFSDAFLIVCPGITIRDRLNVLLPSDPANYYEHRGILPDDMIGDVRKARIVITNYHAFKHRETLSIPKYAREVLQGRDEPLSTIENDGQMLARVCPELLARKNIIVLNDEAHHCYEQNPGEGVEEKIDADEKEEVNENKKAARLWINGIKALDALRGVRAVYDLSATPFFLKGSGYKEGTLFPWVVSDFSLMDAIESGIVKVPRVPVSDNALGYKMPAWRNLWAEIKQSERPLPRKGAKKGGGGDPEQLPEVLLGALHALYEHYEKVFDNWGRDFGRAGINVPPVFIVVCQNTAHSQLLFDYISGYVKKETTPDGQQRDVIIRGKLKLFDNYRDDKKPHERPRTLIIDSNQLDSGESMSAEFKKIAGPEIDAYRNDLRTRKGEGAAMKLTDEDLLREVMNTVGKEGRLGEQIRCVVSVSMLTEGWDANTVTHVLGVRAFGTELLCEQVVGRALRRVAYDMDEDGMFSPEYANVFGIPFAFAQESKGEATFIPPKPARRIFADEIRRGARPELEIRFPRVQGYRVKLPGDYLKWEWDTKDSPFTLDPSTTPTRAKIEDVLGHGETITLDNFMDQRPKTVAFHVAGHALRSRFRDEDGNLKPYLFPRILNVAEEWLGTQLTCAGGAKPGLFLWKPLADEAVLRIYNACVRGGLSAGEAETPTLLPIIDSYNPEGSSRYVDFRSSRELAWKTRADMCHVTEVIGDVDWELTFCETLEAMNDVVIAYVKNHALGFELPYATRDGERRYRPDFIVKLDDGRGAEDPLNLIVEIKGYRRLDAQNKREAATTHWVPAVNAHGAYGRWAFIEIGDVYTSAEKIREMIIAVAKAA